MRKRGGMPKTIEGNREEQSQTCNGMIGSRLQGGWKEAMTDREGECQEKMKGGHEESRRGDATKMEKKKI